MPEENSTRICYRDGWHKSNRFPNTVIHIPTVVEEVFYSDILTLENPKHEPGHRRTIAAYCPIFQRVHFGVQQLIVIVCE